MDNTWYDLRGVFRTQQSIQKKMLSAKIINSFQLLTIFAKVSSQQALSFITFVYSRFPPKVQFLYCLLSSLSLNLGPQLAGKCVSNTFSDSRYIACTLFVWSNSCIEFYWEIQRKVDYCSRVKLKRLSFITQFKMSFYCCLWVVEKCLEKCLLRCSTRF